MRRVKRVLLGLGIENDFLRYAELGLNDVRLAPRNEVADRLAFAQRDFESIPIKRFVHLRVGHKNERARGGAQRAPPRYLGEFFRALRPQLDRAHEFAPGANFLHDVIAECRDRQREMRLVDVQGLRHAAQRRIFKGLGNAIQEFKLNRPHGLEVCFQTLQVEHRKRRIERADRILVLVQQEGIAAVPAAIPRAHPANELLLERAGHVRDQRAQVLHRRRQPQHLPHRRIQVLLFVLVERLQARIVVRLHHFQRQIGQVRDEVMIALAAIRSEGVEAAAGRLVDAKNPRLTAKGLGQRLRSGVDIHRPVKTAVFEAVRG